MDIDIKLKRGDYRARKDAPSAEALGYDWPSLRDLDAGVVARLKRALIQNARNYGGT